VKFYGSFESDDGSKSSSHMFYNGDLDFAIFKESYPRYLSEVYFMYFVKSDGPNDNNKLLDQKHIVYAIQEVG
jgi:hypothetical protein